MATMDEAKLLAQYKALLKAGYVVERVEGGDVHLVKKTVCKPHEVLDVIEREDAELAAICPDLAKEDFDA